MTTGTASAVERDYAAVTEGAGLLDRSARGQVEVAGPDAAEYLQGQVTNDVLALESHQGCYAALLDPKGHIVSDMRILSGGPGQIAIDLEPDAHEPVLKHLRMYKIGRQVQVEDFNGARGLLSLIGPRAREAFEAAGRVDPGKAVPSAEHAWVHGQVGGIPVVVIATDVGLDLQVEADDESDRRADLLGQVRDALVAAGAQPVDDLAADILRIERGRPRFGIDMSQANLPAEAGIVERAVSFTKGCYIGQEPVARMHHRGRPNRRLRGLRLSAPVPPGAAVMAGDREAGRLTSSVTSPRQGPIGLVILRREVDAGDEVIVGDPAVGAQVVELPFDAE
jgi:folate-binding protein YgfZ